MNRTIPLIILHPQRADKVIMQIALSPAVLHHGSHCIKQLPPLLYVTYTLATHIYAPEQLAGHSFGQDNPVIRSRHFFERTGKDTASQQGYHLRRCRQLLRIKNRFGTIRQVNTFPPSLVTVHAKHNFLPQHTAYPVTPTIQQGFGMLQRIFPFHHIQILIPRPETVIMRLRPQPVHAERQAHDAHRQTDHGDHGLPPLVAQAAKSLLEILNP